jgi:putative DNA methylase
VSAPKKKLIEVALPLEAINKASAREKSIRHGHPSTLHLWWARRPLAAARAVIFAQMVDDPGNDEERQKLFDLIEELVKWENTTNEKVLEQAREEIRKSWRATCAENQDHPRTAELFNPDKLPAFHDPFAGGGALPLEAQRLGLESYASDLNPVAVLINKAMIEIPPKFAGGPPVNPEAREDKTLFSKQWRGAQGLAEDVRYYGKWMRDEAERRIGHLYPKIKITEDIAKDREDLKPYIGQSLTVIAWLWARTVKSPNPAFRHVDVPLASTFMLSSKPGKEAYVEPVIEESGYHFTVKTGKPKDAERAKNGTKLARGANFRCVMSGSPIAPDYIYSEANAGRMNARLMAIVAEGERGRVYLTPTIGMESIAHEAKPEWKPEVAMPENPRWFSPPLYGLKTYGDIFTPRQLVALTTFSDLVQEAREQVKHDAVAAGMPYDDTSLHNGGVGTAAYADGLCIYFALMVSRSSDRHNTICSWDMGPASSKSSTGSPARSASIRNAFSRQAIPMSWDYAEGNPLSESATNFLDSANWIAKVLDRLHPHACGKARQRDATGQGIDDVIVSTDPPYYDNIGYADLSDFFYIWLRRSLRPVIPDLFTTLTVPKAEELVATPYRHGSKEQAEAFFLNGMTQAMHRLAKQTHPAFPVTIYYAFKQAETETAGTASTGWETFLDAVIEAGFAISGTWPMRTELGNRIIGMGTNALASSIVLVCRPRLANAPTATRREFLNQLKAELPDALATLQRGNIAPVDLAQAAIGPGMAIFTRYAKVLDAAGKAMSVHDALMLINQTLDEVLTEQEGDFDANTRWALAWFEQFSFNDGPFGDAETLSKAKATAVNGLENAGLILLRGGRVRLLRPAELPADWAPEEDSRPTIWKMVHHIVRALEAGGESAAAQLVARLGGKAEVARELAYRLYTLCERRKRAAEALSYNSLVQSWPEIARLAREGGKTSPEQQELSGF